MLHASLSENKQAHEEVERVSPSCSVFLFYNILSTTNSIGSAGTSVETQGLSKTDIYPVVHVPSSAAQHQNMLKLDFGATLWKTLCPTDPHSKRPVNNPVFVRASRERKVLLGFRPQTPACEICHTAFCHGRSWRLPSHQYSDAGWKARPHCLIGPVRSADAQERHVVQNSVYLDLNSINSNCAESVSTMVVSATSTPRMLLYI